MGCSICKDDGGCLNSPSHPNYEEYYDAEDKLSYFNCWNYLYPNEKLTLDKELDLIAYTMKWIIKLGK